MTPLLPTLAVLPVGAYVYDVYVRPKDIARKARAYADSVGKPLLNVGAGTRRSSARVLLFGNTGWGDINTDLTGTGTPRFGDPRHVYHLDLTRPIPFPDKTFGATIASHCLEQVPDPNASLRELVRVSDKVYFVDTKRWDVLAWLHPDQQWRWNGREFERIQKTRM